MEVTRLTNNDLKQMVAEAVEHIIKERQNMNEGRFERFEKCKDMSQVYIELDKVGLSQVFIAKLIAQYKTPQKIIDVVKQNPYQLIKDIAGVGFFTADRIALKSDFTVQDVRRIKAYITWFLESQGEDGHSYVSAGELMGSLYEDLGGKNAVVKIICDEETGEETNNIALAMKELQEDGTIINVLDIVNIIIAMLIVVCTVFLFVDLKENEKLFTVVFLLATVMNVDMVVKYYKRVDIPRTVALSLFALLLLVLSVLSFVTLWI